MTYCEIKEIKTTTQNCVYMATFVLLRDINQLELHVWDLSSVITVRHSQTQRGQPFLSYLQPVFLEFSNRFNSIDGRIMLTKMTKSLFYSSTIPGSNNRRLHIRATRLQKLLWSVSLTDSYLKNGFEIFAWNILNGKMIYCRGTSIVTIRFKCRSLCWNISFLMPLRLVPYQVYQAIGWFLVISLFYPDQRDTSSLQ